MPNNYFKFKRFTVFQDGAAMKVGTDGVLLGAWFTLDGTENRVLDVGTGTGLIALMAAQRSPRALVDAVEIDRDAARQARQNVEISPWKERIAVFPASLQEYAARTPCRYDRIVSNPPYFLSSLKPDDGGRLAARHADALPYEDLIRGATALLKPGGTFAAIFPYREASVFTVQAAVAGLYCVRRLNVYPVPGGPVKRVLLEFSFDRGPVDERTLVIGAPESGGYTDDYRRLTADFYLYF